MSSHSLLYAHFLLLFTFLLHLLPGQAQTLQFRNDSLFINKSFVNGFTTKEALDSLVGANGRIKKRPGKYKMKLVQYIYKKKGLKFTKNDVDESQLWIAVKLSKHSNPAIDNVNMPGELFKGQLFIDENYMNDKKEIDQFQHLVNCAINNSKSNFVSHITLVYKQRPIRVILDFSTTKPTIIYID